MKQKRKSEYDFCWSWDYVQCLCMYIFINQQFLKVSWVTQVAYWYLIQLVCVCQLVSFWSIHNFFSDDTPVQILGYCFFSVCHSVILIETLTFWEVSAWVLIFHMDIPCDKTFLLVPKYFDPVTLTFEFGLLFENLNLVNNFSTASARGFIFQMNRRSFCWY